MLPEDLRLTDGAAAGGDWRRVTWAEVADRFAPPPTASCNGTRFAGSPTPMTTSLTEDADKVNVVPETD